MSDIEDPTCPEGMRVLLPGKAYICNRCGKSWWRTGLLGQADGPHQCPPDHRAWIKQDGDEYATTVLADNLEEAARRFVEERDCYEGDLTAEEVVVVERLGEEKTFRVTGELVREYRAEAIE